MAFSERNHRKSRGFALVLVLATLGAAADLISKQYVFQWLGLPPSRVYWIWQPYVGLETSVNTGALFGMGQGQATMFAIISIAAMAGILAWLAWGEAAQNWGLCIILGVVLGGIAGNLYDRLGCWGRQGVRDWILLKYGDFVWPNFNIADSLLVCGACLMAVHALRGDSSVREHALSSADHNVAATESSESCLE